MERNAGEMKRLNPLVFFSAGAVVDFVLGWIRGHSFWMGVVAVPLGLPLTAFLFWSFDASAKGSDDSGDPNR
jgi:hypothetical protein